MTGDAVREQPGVTVLINTYEHRASIAPCLEAVLAQRIDLPIEVIVVDDGSADGTADLVDQILDAQDSIPWRHVRKHGAGGVACRQHAFNIAAHPLVLMLGGDCVLLDDTLLATMVDELAPDEPFVSLYGPHGGMGTLYRLSAVRAVGGFHLGFNRFGSGFRDDSDLHYRLLDRHLTGRYLPDLAASFSHRQPRPSGFRGALAYALHRVAVHQLDALLYRRNPARFAEDFPLVWRITDPTGDFRRATGLWRDGGRMELSSPQGVVLVRGGTTGGRIVAVIGGLAYVVAVRAARFTGALRYRTVLL
ncbi:MAG: glycosyltransferase [Pseudonocardiaceae bacterium]